MKARLLEFRDVAPDVRLFTFSIPELESFSFQPGQFVSLTEQRNGRPVTRAYSLAAPPDGNRFEICLNHVADGAFSPYLFTLEAGAEVPVRGPVGTFVPRAAESHVFVATGTGVVPFRAMLRSPGWLEAQREVTLIFGARYPAGLMFLDEFRELAGTHPHFRLMPTVTRPDAAWQGASGRVQPLLQDVAAASPRATVYVCGLKAMVDDVRLLLKERGFERHQIVYEKYD